METPEEPVQVIRETTRNLLKLNRQVHKDEIADLGRSINTVRVTPSSLADIANRLKTKSAVSLAELHILKNSLLDDVKNIELVLSTYGSLRGLVRELSGTDVKRQSVAAGCCCNLALGDSKACFTVTKAAGPYLVAALDNFNEDLAVTCAWALGNLAGSGERAGGALQAQGAGDKLARLLRGARSAPRDAAIYALTHFAYQMKDNFSPDHLKIIIEAYPNIELNSASAQLLFILTCHDQMPPGFPGQLLLNMLQAVSVSMQNMAASTESDECYKLVHLLRTLANLSANKQYSESIVNYLEETRLCVDIKRILSSDNGVVKDSLLWLLGNLFNTCGESGFFSELARC